MKRRKLITIAGLVIAMSLMTACSQTAVQETASATVVDDSINEQSDSSDKTMVEEPTEEEPAEEEPAEEEPVEEIIEEIMEEEACPLEDGVYQAKFNTDSGMFHVNETLDGMGTLYVSDGKMTIHVTLAGKGILNLYPGSSEEAMADGAVLLEPTTDEVTYDDGETEEVNGFDIPVPYLDEEFDCALIGKKGVWYDHKVSVSDVQSADEASKSKEAAKDSIVLEDGEYEVSVVLEGGSGKATVLSPAKIKVVDTLMIATIEWSSSKYDFMMIGEDKYLPINTEGNSVFEIPVSALDTPIDVQADTVAMSKPHLIDYTLTFSVVE